MKAIPTIKSCMPITNLRRSTRSPRTPPQGLTTSAGRRFTAPTVMTSRAKEADPSVKPRTSQPTERSCSHSAPLEQKLPVQRSRKLG